MEHFPLTFGGAAWAMEKYFRDRNRKLTERIRALREEIHQEFSLEARIIEAISGRFIAWRIRSEERRLRNGWRYEPRTFIERRNWGLASR
jgi:hypothetical protein